MRYRHLVPHIGEWRDIESSKLPQRVTDNSFQGQLIADYYSYNDNRYICDATGNGNTNETFARVSALGMHWVGDLAYEAKLQVKNESGTISFDLVEGGAHFTCQVNLEDGQAKLLSTDSGVKFIDDEGNAVETPTGQTALKGSGYYNIRYANIDDQITLWVNESVVKFDADKYERAPLIAANPGMLLPVYDVNDPGDAEPAGIGSKGAELEISRMRLLRDLYYVSVKNNQNTEYQNIISVSVNHRRRRL